MSSTKENVFVTRYSRKELGQKQRAATDYPIPRMPQRDPKIREVSVIRRLPLFPVVSAPLVRGVEGPKTWEGLTGWLCIMVGVRQWLGKLGHRAPRRRRPCEVGQRAPAAGKDRAVRPHSPAS